jgi:predicted unusual protein kinase regulating ubiquinone biosynthesis (AarF/ABC1/UbiB family)
MSKSIAANQIERQIESLPPVEQIKMLERVIRHLKRLLIAQPVEKIAGKKITEKLNCLYKDETSRIEPELSRAQFISIGRDSW